MYNKIPFQAQRQRIIPRAIHAKSQSKLCKKKEKSQLQTYKKTYLLPHWTEEVTIINLH